MEQSNNTTSTPDNAADINFSIKVLRVLKAVRDFAKSTMYLGDDMDLPGTIDTIKKDMVFRGYVVWILICSIFIASIGLNVNSVAVVIGAMLISPLMGPILAIGLAVGTNDRDTLKRALKNFAVMVVVSLITSTLYFLITPLQEAQPELLARTKPTFLDVLIAIFGGLAGIIGVSRRTRGNVIPGVAIATALMPPLCTAGYGLANGEWSYFFGAFYLFTLNSVFIAGATLVIVRYLKFPLVSFMDPETEQRVKRYMIIGVIVVILPSAWIFYGLVQETLYLGKAENFIAQHIESIEGTEVISKKVTYSDTLSVIDVYIMGEPIAEPMKKQLERTMAEKGLNNTTLRIHQPKDMTNEIAGKLSDEVRVGIIEDLYRKNEQLIAQKEATIQQLQKKLQGYEQHNIPIRDVSKELNTLFPDLEKVAFANSIVLDQGRSDTVPTLLVHWRKTPTDNGRERNVLQVWFKERLDLDTLQLVEF